MVLLFFFFLAFILIASAIFYGIGPNQTPTKALRIIVESLPKDVKVIYDLGSGFGLTSLYFAIKRPDVTVIGLEASLLPFLFSKIFTLFQKNVQFYWKNFYTVSLKDADVVYCYLYRKAMKKLAEKFEKELKNGASVISYTFSLKKKQHQVIDAGSYFQNKLYLYKF